jgi:hypothetical protein
MLFKSLRELLVDAAHLLEEGKMTSEAITSHEEGICSYLNKKRDAEENLSAATRLLEEAEKRGAPFEEWKSIHGRVTHWRHEVGQLEVSSIFIRCELEREIYKARGPMSSQAGKEPTPAERKAAAICGCGGLCDSGQPCPMAYNVRARA